MQNWCLWAVLSMRQSGLFITSPGVTPTHLRHFRESRPSFLVFAPAVSDKGRTSCHWRSDFLSKRTDWLLQRVDGIIAATAGGYEDAHRSNSKLIGTITFPVDGRVLDRTEENPIIRVVHGINRKYSKGSDKIIEALQNTDLEEKAQVKVLEQLPFELYMQEIANADIVIDQLYGDGLGMNALHAMAAGKLVLTSYDEALYPSSPAIPIAQTKTGFGTTNRKQRRQVIGRSVCSLCGEYRIRKK